MCAVLPKVLFNFPFINKWKLVRGSIQYRWSFKGVSYKIYGPRKGALYNIYAPRKGQVTNINGPFEGHEWTEKWAKYYILWTTKGQQST